MNTFKFFQKNRTKHGLTQALAKRLKVTVSYVSDSARGRAVSPRTRYISQVLYSAQSLMKASPMVSPAEAVDMALRTTPKPA